jgi:hypothetical protein
MSAEESSKEDMNSRCNLLTIGQGVKLLLLWDSNATCRRLHAMQNPLFTRPVQPDEEREQNIDTKVTHIHFSYALLRHGGVVVCGGDIVERY